ncbi:polysaccharide deacetylase family protein [Lentzea sp. NPDC042327]|uniref:polysaccharide deacetylase family protein n=1 Tax=Lentzea sp. NPDC042327 TaxID=3154801 RepID=UPI0033C6458C
MIRRLARRLVLPLTAPIGSVRQVSSPQPHVVLTYDDGPQPGATERVLESLANSGCTATFFVLTGRARKHPGLLAEVQAAGHEIALHGVDHVRLTTLAPKEVRARTADGKHFLEDVLGTEVRWFRPPYGAQRPATYAAIRATGMDSVVWDVAAFDWEDDPAATIAERTLREVHSGAVVLMHDGYAGPEDGVDDGPAPTFDRGELARLVCAGLAERGLKGVSLRDALAHGRPVKRAWFRS